MYLFSAIVLLSGLYAVYSQSGIRKGSLAPWAWAMVAIVGLVFVLIQLRATVLVGNLVINGPRPASREASTDPDASES